MQKRLLDNTEMVEALADYAHNAWSGWMQYMFGKMESAPGGSRIMPASLVQRWTRQMETPYSELPEVEKESDRKEARQIVEILEEHAG